LKKQKRLTKKLSSLRKNNSFMITKNNFVFLLFFSVATFAQSQQFYVSYDWETSPNYKVEETDKDIIALKEKVVTEFYFEGQNLVEYYLEHKVLWLNSDDRIEEYNKVYLPYSNRSKLEVNKARVIKKNGEIIVLDESKILTAEDDATGRKYKYFAFEGIEKGSVIEYYYVEKRSPRYQGARFDVQNDYDKLSVEFDLYSPNNLVFDFKSFNNIPDVIKDETSTEKSHWKLAVNNINGVKNEEQAPYEAATGFIIYKLDKNTSSNVTITSYNNVANNLYPYYYPVYDEDTNNLINQFAKDIGITNEMDAETKTRTIDLYIKENVFYSETGGENLKELNTVITNKTADETGVIKLYIALFRKFGITHEIVLTTNRLKLKFDKEFEATNFLNEFLIYFPESKKYLAPSKFGTRFGFPPSYYMDNYGLFITGYNIDNKIKAFAEIKYIEGLEAKHSTDVMQIDVRFDTNDFTKNNIKLDRKLHGYYAMNIQPFMNLIPADRKNEIIDDSFAKSIDTDAQVIKREILNEDPSLFGLKPFQVKFELTSESFVEKAGNKFLFKLGDLIGPQMEMYQEKKRVLPLEAEFNRSYYRTIVVNIPEGYRISNLEDIVIKNMYSKNGKDLFVFDSYYKLEGNVLTVTADEHYRETIVAPEIYEEYRKVINSAADFNKVTLVLEKK
tara:strand:+ start:5976 stop:7997 length:2022 start_codon:yes stop_codon:yes gene_type:complete